MDNKTPLTNEEIAMYFTAVTSDLKDNLVKFNKDLSLNVDNLATAITDKLKKSFDEQNKILEKISSNISNMGVDICGIKTSVPNVAQIDNIVFSVKELKDSLSNIANARSDVEAESAGKFQFVSKLSDKEKYEWREEYNKKVRSLAVLSGLAHQDTYNKVYDTMKKISGIDVYELRRTRKIKTSAINMVSNSDVLMGYFKQAIQHLMASFAIDSPERDFNSVDAMRCPELIRELAARLARKKVANNYDITQLYKLFNSHQNLKYLVETTKKSTNYKNINKGFAILYSTNGYENLVKMIDDELSNNN